VGGKIPALTIPGTALQGREGPSSRSFLAPAAPWLVLTIKMIPEALRDESDHKARVSESFIHVIVLLFLPADS